MNTIYNYLRISAFNPIAPPLYKGNRLSTTNISLPSIPNLSSDFYNWLCGFADGESTFYISLNPNGTIKGFIFRIGLHIDDRDLLVYLRDMTGLGRVHDSKRNNTHWVVTDRSEIAIIIAIFTEYPLLSSKLWDF
jgi:hypothetical protein